ncbi:hypothetical protein RyT2_24090 [Pseudolactococcus yaeyamensis]
MLEKYAPSQMEVQNVLEQLINDDSKINRKKIAMWAFKIHDDVNLKSENLIVNKVVSWISMVDLIDPSVDNGFVYNKFDFEEWLKNLNE